MKLLDAATLTRFQALACVVSIWAAIYLPGLGSLEIKGEEGRRLLPAVTMLATGNWVVPRVGGVDYLAKPPLINWLAAGAFKLAGDPRSEWAARAPSVLAVLALGLCTVAALGRWLGNGGALLAAVFLLTNIGLMEKGRLAEIEALYLSLTGIAIVLWLGAWRHDVVESDGRPSWRAWTLPWVFLGLGMLTKGPLHLLFFYAVVAGVLVCAGRRRDWLNGPHLFGIVLMLGIFGAWAVPYLRQTAAGHSGGVWWEQFRGRLEVNEKFHLAAWLLNVPRGLVNYLPWTVLLPLAWRRGPLAAANPGDATETLDLAIARGLRWAVAGCFLAVSLAPGGQPRYTLPLLTPASVLLALVLVREWRWPTWLPGVWARTISFCLALAFVGAVAAVVLDASGFQAWIVALVTAAAWWAWNSRAPGPARWHILALASAAAMGLLTADYAVGAVPFLRRTDNQRRQADEINQAALGESVTVLRPGFVPFLFYLRPAPRYAQEYNAIEVPPSVQYLLIREQDEESAATAWEFENREWFSLLHVADKRTRSGWILVRLGSVSKEGL